MATIRIRVGASLDRSVESVFGTIEARAAKAGRVVQQYMEGKGGRGGAYRERPAAKGYEADAKAAEASARRQTKAMDESAKQQIRFFKEIGKSAEQEFSKRARAAQRAADQETRAAQRARDQFAARMGGSARRGVNQMFPSPMGMVGAARRFGNDLLRGSGVDMNLSSSMARGLDLEKSSLALSNQGRDLADPRNAQRVSAATLANEARTLGAEFGMDPQQIIKAQEAFVGLTGDLATARDRSREFMQLSAATGTDPVAMMEAAGQASMVLPDGPEKGAQLSGLMRMIAGQGKVGAGEIKHMAKGMAGLASAAPSYTGDVAETIGKLGALAQISLQSGGSKSTNMAVVGVERFTSTFQTAARQNAFKKHGINVIGDDNLVRDPFEIIRESLTATKGDNTEMGKLWSSVMGQRGVRGLTTAYNQAGGGDAGLAAVNQLLAKFSKDATLTSGQIEEDAGLVADSDAAKAQRFQIELDKVTNKMRADLLPTLEKLAPKFLELVESFSKVVQWAAENPGKAITAAIVASLAKAGLSAAAAGAVEALIRSAPSKGGVGTVIGEAVTKGRAGVNNAGNAAAVPAAVAAVAGVALAADQASKLSREVGSSVNLLDVLPGFKDGKFDGDTLLETFNPLAHAKKVARTTGTLASDVWNFDKNADAKAKAEALERARNPGASSEGVTAAEIGKSVASDIAAKELRVRVTNASEISGGGAEIDPTGQSPAP